MTESDGDDEKDEITEPSGPETRLSQMLALGTDTDDEAANDDEQLTLSRRKYVATAGLLTASVTGWPTGSDGTIDLDPVQAFGYGGSAVVQTESQSVSISESEPNDTQDNATAVSYGSTVTATLTQTDSDWYAVDRSAGDTLAVSFQRQAQSGVTALMVYSPDGSLLNIRYVATADTHSFTEEAEVTGTHLIQVVDTQNSDGDYMLTIGSSGSDDGTSTPTPTPTPTATPTPTPTPTEEDDYGEQGYGEQGYGGVSS